MSHVCPSCLGREIEPVRVEKDNQNNIQLIFKCLECNHIAPSSQFEQIVAEVGHTDDNDEPRDLYTIFALGDA